MKAHVSASPRQVAQVPPIAAAGSQVLQRKCACGASPGPSGECEACRKKRLQRKSGHAAEPSGVPSIVYDVLRSPGQPLDSGTRAFFEPRFGHDFSQVRVHTDTRAAESARSVNALAYTVGRDVVFGREGYRPDSESGRRLVAHELTHVVQQRDIDRLDRKSNLEIDAGSAAESEAAAVERSIMGDGLLSVRAATGAVLARDSVPAPPADPLREAADAITSAVLVEQALGIRPGDPVWGKLNVLWMVHLLQVLEKSSALGQLAALDRHVDRAGGGTNLRLRVAIEAVKKKVAGGVRGQIDSELARILTTLANEKQRSEVIEYVSGRTTTTVIVPEKKPGQADFLSPPEKPPTTITSGDSVASYNTAQKLEMAVGFAGEELGPQFAKGLSELATPESLATLAAFFTVYLVSQATPAGWVADVIAGGLLAVSIVMVGFEVIEVVEHLLQFAELASGARSKPELRKAGEHLAIAIRKVGIDVVVAILFKKAGKIAKPYLRPPPPAELQSFKITSKGATSVPNETFAANDNANPFNENLRSNVIDLSSRRPAPTRSSGGTQGSLALQTEPQPQMQPEIAPQAVPKPAPQSKPAVSKPPSLASRVDPGVVGAAAASKAQKEKKNREPCNAQWKSRAGGGAFTNYHNAFAAAMVSRFRLPASPELDYSVAKGGKESTDYDSFDARSNDLYEFKTRHQFLPYEQLTITWIRSTGMAAQAADQHNTRIVCQIPGKLIWIFDREDVANAARPLLRQMGVDIVYAEPWSMGRQGSEP